MRTWLFIYLCSWASKPCVNDKIVGASWSSVENRKPSAATFRYISWYFYEIQFFFHLQCVASFIFLIGMLEALIWEGREEKEWLVAVGTVWVALTLCHKVDKDAKSEVQKARCFTPSCLVVTVFSLLKWGAARLVGITFNSIGGLQVHDDYKCADLKFLLCLLLSHLDGLHSSICLHNWIQGPSDTLGTSPFADLLPHFAL